MAQSGFWRNLRLLILLLILFFVAADTWYEKARTTDWDEPLWVTLYPINGDGSEAVAHYLAGLQHDDFQAIEDFFADQARDYGLGQRQPFKLTLGAPLGAVPPARPAEPSMLGSMAWSLRMRYWAWRETPSARTRPDVRVYMLFYDVAQHERLPHSSGLQKGLVGVTHLFADARYAGINRVVIAHELLHTVGASDKYDPATNLPLFPLGYADPNQSPTFPQFEAEIMAGRIPLSAREARQADNLAEVVVGAATALEIGWRKP